MGGNTIRRSRFKVESVDSSGQEFTIEHTKVFMVGDELYDQYYETEDGEPVKENEDGSFKILLPTETVIVRRVQG